MVAGQEVVCSWPCRGPLGMAERDLHLLHSYESTSEF